MRREIATAIATDTDLLDLVTGKNKVSMASIERRDAEERNQAIEQHHRLLVPRHCANTAWTNAFVPSGWMQDGWLFLSRVCDEAYKTFQSTLLPYLQNRLSVLGDRIFNVLNQLDREDVQKIEGLVVQAGDAFGFSPTAKVTIAAAFVLLNMMHKRALK